MDLSLLVDVQHQPNQTSYVPIIVLSKGTIAMQHFESRYHRFSPLKAVRRQVHLRHAGWRLWVCMQNRCSVREAAAPGSTRADQNSHQQPWWRITNP
jgi:hypothetical protein